MATFEELEDFLLARVPLEVRRIRAEVEDGGWDESRVQAAKARAAHTVQAVTLQSDTESWWRLVHALATAIVFTPEGITFCGRHWDDPDRRSRRLHS